MARHAKDADSDLYCNVEERDIPAHRLHEAGDIGAVKTKYGVEIIVRIKESYKSGFLADRVNDPFGLPVMGPWSSFELITRTSGSWDSQPTGEVFYDGDTGLYVDAAGNEVTR